MLLCIDIGNTNIKLGLFDGDLMRCHWRVATDRARLPDEYAMTLIGLLASENLTLSQVTGCAISSVVPALTQAFTELSERYLRRDPLVVTPDSSTGMKVNTEFPQEVGSDLVVNALAARHLYGPPLIVIGFGTATTFVAVSAEGSLEGVAIAPGIITSGDSLFRATSTLPQVALKRPAAAIGRNTVASIQAGMVFGFTGLVEGVVRRMQAEMASQGKVKVIATGGLAPLIAPETDLIDAVDSNLALTGLRLVYERSG